MENISTIIKNLENDIRDFMNNEYGNNIQTACYHPEMKEEGEMVYFNYKDVEYCGRFFIWHAQGWFKFCKLENLR